MIVQRLNDDGIFAVPKFTVNKDDAEGFMEELRGFHSEFAGCFTRSEPREHFFQYMVGQFSEIERKSIEPIALTVEGGDVRSLQRFITNVPWDEEKMMRKYHALINEDMGDPNGVLIFDESAFVKKGNDSAGVARQYCGTTGKIENCQVGVFAAYASPHGYALLDKRLFIPEKWFMDTHKDRRESCRIDDSLVFKTKPQLAVGMFQSISNEGIIPFKYVVADSFYGRNSEFTEAINAGINITYFVAIPSDTLCWLKEPLIEEKKYRYKGQTRSKKLLKEKEKEPVRVDALAHKINPYFWYRRTVSEGAKGPIAYEFTKRQVTLSKNGLPDKTVWLVIRRTIGNNPVYSYYISNAPVSTRLKTFVWLSGIRWAIEQCFEETKTELGMDHYEVRKYPAWDHHISMCMLAHFFLWHLKIRLGKKSTTRYTVSDEDSPGGCLAA
jgi:SRSO17 transposase